MKAISLILVSTFGVGLKFWQDKGLYDREIGYYHKLEQYFKNFGVISYDKEFAKPKNENYEYYYNSLRLPKFLYSIIAVFQHAKGIRKYEIVKTNQFAGAWTAALIKVLFKNKIFVLRGGHAWDYESGNSFIRGLSDIVMRWCFAMADLIFFVSENDKNKYLNRDGHKNEHKMRIVPNSIDIDIFYPKSRPEKHEINILLVGRLVKMKNFQGVFEAVALMDSSIRENIKIDVIGEGEYKNTLEEIVLDKGLTVIFHGALPNSKTVEFLNKSDIFILPQLYGSGMSKGLLEAMATGNIVIASDLPAHRNTIDEGKDGFICEFSPESIRERLEYVIKNINSSDINIIRQLAIKKVQENFSMDVVVKKEYEYILEICDKYHEN